MLSIQRFGKRLEKKFFFVSFLHFLSDTRIFCRLKKCSKVTFSFVKSETSNEYYSDSSNGLRFRKALFHHSFKFARISRQLKNANFENVKKQKMDLFTILTIPEYMNPRSPSLKKLWWFVKLGKILKNSLIWTFFAIILALGQKNPKFLYFLNPYTCTNLGQVESQKLRSILVIT